MRPDSWNFPLLLHILGASLLLGSVITAVTAQLLAWKRTAPADLLPYSRLSFRTLLFAAIPAWFLMLIGAEWVASKGWNDVEPTPFWLDLGYGIAYLGGLVLLVAVILAGLGARNLRRSSGERGTTLVRVATVLAGLLVIGLVIVAWAMAAKPD
jgi:hypothetical protein